MKKRIFILILTILLTTSLVFSSVKLGREIRDPYGRVLYNAQKELPKSGSVRYDGSFYSEFGNLIYDYYNKKYGENFKKDEKSFCMIGGTYKDNEIIWDNRWANLNESLNLFSCPNTMTLLKYVQIPTQWINEKYIVYCNEGLDTYVQEENFDFFLGGRKVQSYRGCVVKNLDRKTNNTIIYGMDANKLVEKANTMFLNELADNRIYDEFEYSQFSAKEIVNNAAKEITELEFLKSFYNTENLIDNWCANAITQGYKTYSEKDLEILCSYQKNADKKLELHGYYDSSKLILQKHSNEQIIKKNLPFTHDTSKYLYYPGKTNIIMKNLKVWDSGKGKVKGKSGFKLHKHTATNCPEYSNSYFCDNKDVTHYVAPVSESSKKYPVTLKTKFGNPNMQKGTYNMFNPGATMDLIIFRTDRKTWTRFIFDKMYVEYDSTLNQGFRKYLYNYPYLEKKDNKINQILASNISTIKEIDNFNYNGYQFNNNLIKANFATLELSKKEAAKLGDTITQTYSKNNRNYYRKILRLGSTNVYRLSDTPMEEKVPLLETSQTGINIDRIKFTNTRFITIKSDSKNKKLYSWEKPHLLVTQTGENSQPYYFLDFIDYNSGCTNIKSNLKSHSNNLKCSASTLQIDSNSYNTPNTYDGPQKAYQLLMNIIYSIS